MVIKADRGKRFCNLRKSPMVLLIFNVSVSYLRKMLIVKYNNQTKSLFSSFADVFMSYLTENKDVSSEIV